MSHWYDKTGEPMHKLPNKSKPGELRDTTLRDARKLNLAPSVTTVLKDVVAKGDILWDWSIKQALYSALVHPSGSLPQCARNPDGSISEKDPAFLAWAKDCMADAKRQVNVKAERGSILHDAMMMAHHAYHNIEPQYLAHVDGMFAMLEQNFGKRQWIAEQSFACPTMCVGGSVDLHTHPDDPDPIVLDYKFKDFGEDRDAAYFVYDEHTMQLGAYRMGVRLPTARCFNAFGSISTPGLVLLHAHTEKDIKRGEEMFLLANRLYQIKHDYRPKW